MPGHVRSVHFCRPQAAQGSSRREAGPGPESVQRDAHEFTSSLTHYFPKIQDPKGPEQKSSAAKEARTCEQLHVAKTSASCESHFMSALEN